MQGYGLRPGLLLWSIGDFGERENSPNFSSSETVSWKNSPKMYYYLLRPAELHLKSFF